MAEYTQDLRDCSTLSIFCRQKKEQLSKVFSEKPEPSTKYTPRGDDVLIRMLWNTDQY